MFEVTLYIPIADNDKKLFTHEHHALFEECILNHFGGFTFAGTVKGSWADAGVTYRDTNRVYRVALISIAEGHKVGEVVTFAKAHYRQEAIFVRYLGLAEIL